MMRWMVNIFPHRSSRTSTGGTMQSVECSRAWLIALTTSAKTSRRPITARYRVSKKTSHSSWTKTYHRSPITDHGNMKTEEILKKIRGLEIKTRALVETAFAGDYHSVFKGRGMNFEEGREYQPGDEIRAIDWNVTARLGSPFVKKFTEERELTVMLIVDVSASGNFGSTSQSKRELAAEVACLLAFSAIRNNDKVGLLLFTDRVELFIPPKKGRSHTLRLIREILFFEPQGRGTQPALALDYLNKIVTRPA